MAKIKTGPKVKRKGGGVPAKSRAVDALAEQLSGSTALIVTEYRGLKVMEFQGLRKRLRDRHVEYHVVKNSLLSRAATKTQREGLRSFLSGPTAVALSKLPGKPQLQAEIVGSLQAPLAQMVGLINAPFQAIVHVFSARGSSS